MQAHDDRLAKLEDEMKVLQSMSAPKGEDGTNVMQALGELIKNLEQRLISRIGGVEDDLNSFVKKSHFDQAVNKLTNECERLQDQKADRSEMDEKL